MTRAVWSFTYECPSCLKPLVFFAALAPLSLLVWEAFTDNLGANPIEEIELRTGRWALRFIAITLWLIPLSILRGIVGELAAGHDVPEVRGRPGVRYRWLEGDLRTGLSLASARRQPSRAASMRKRPSRSRGAFRRTRPR
mgnify:CR=1 FL=1